VCIEVRVWCLIASCEVWFSYRALTPTENDVVLKIFLKNLPPKSKKAPLLNIATVRTLRGEKKK
jgi:hypothetical protein